MSFREQIQDKTNLNITDELLVFDRPQYKFNDSFYNKIKCNDYIIPRKGRRYETPEGNVYPSITTILSKTKSEEDMLILEKWRLREGEEKAQQIIERAKERGTLMHALAEAFIGTPDFKDSQIAFNNDNTGKLFQLIHPELLKIDEVYCVETPLYDDKLKIAGRCDLVARYDGYNSIIDFKSSSKEKEENWIKDYLFQETFYGICFSKQYKKKIERIVTIIAVDETKELQVFVKNPIDYVDGLVERVNKYYKENVE